MYCNCRFKFVQTVFPKGKTKPSVPCTERCVTSKAASNINLFIVQLCYYNIYKRLMTLQPPKIDCQR